MGNRETKYSVIGERNIEMIGEPINDISLVNNGNADYDIKTIINILMSKKISISYDDIIKSIENNFIHRSELKIIYDGLIQANDFDYIFPEHLIMFRLDIVGMIIVVAKINDEYQLREYTIDVVDYANNQIFVTHLIPFIPYLNAA